MEKYAIIMVNASHAKLVIAEVKNGIYFVVRDAEIEGVKLGLDMGKDLFLKKPQIEATINTLKSYKKICDMNGVTKIFALADFAEQNKPKNLYSFFDEVFTVTGFKFELLNDETQNTLLYRAIINTMDIPKGLIVDINADNIHIIHYNRRNILNSVVLPFGANTLLETFPLEELGKEGQEENIRIYLDNRLEELDFLSNLEDDITFIGTGMLFGDISKMVKKLKKYPVDIERGYVMSVSDITVVHEQIKPLLLDKTRKLRGTSEARADVFAVSLIIAEELAKSAKLDSITVGTASIIEGTLFEQAIPATLEKPISDVLGFSLVGQTSYFDQANEKHNEQIYNLSMLLFKQLRVLHKLPRGYIKVLRAAAYLHDMGERVNFYNHAKLAFAGIVGSDIYGLTHREIVLSAFVVSLHQGGDLLASDWVRYAGILTDEDIDAVKKLGIILQIAEAFDRTKNSVIIDINCDILGDSVIMKTEANGDNYYEIKKALECYREFEKNFHKKLEIL
ncbi:MAG: hypothetical protein RR334_00815 [Clostridia bacterium]